MSNEMNTQEEKKVLTQKDLNKAMFRWYMSAEMPLNFENMQGIAFCGSISHILKKLYTKKEDLSEALKRHLLLYNCNNSRWSDPWNNHCNGRAESERSI